jgi:adenine deaminase
MSDFYVLEGKYVDIFNRKIVPARIIFDTNIREIIPLEDAPDSYILPGFVDAHVHIESSMLLPSEFARIAVRHGTLAVVSDPHEIANVLGLEGVHFMLQDAGRAVFRFVFGAPSCVPATSFEDTGISIRDNDIENLFKEGKISFLSEMMNYPGVLHQDSMVMRKLRIAGQYGKPVDGHAPGLTGEALRKYVQAGISTDHECTAIEEAEEKIALGMKILIREGSAAKNFDVLSPLIEKYPEKLMLCTDDFHPDDLLQGHINKLLARAVGKGIDLFSVLRAATINPVDHYSIDLGLLRKGDSADFIVVNNLQDFEVLQSYLNGKCLYDRVGEEEAGEMPEQRAAYPNRFHAATISLPDISVTAETGAMRVIDVVEGELLTPQILWNVQEGGIVSPDTENDILKIVLLNRYLPSPPVVAFIHGFGLKKGALASTVAHDSHHVIAVGCDDISIVKSVNQVIELQGGLSAFYEDKQIHLKLDVAGLMSSQKCEDVVMKYSKLKQAVAEMGCPLSDPFMTLSFMALLVIPELKIGVKGLFDVNKFDWTSTFVSTVPGFGQGGSL